MALWKFNDELAAELKISNLSITFSSQIPDEALFKVGLPFDEDGPFSYDEVVEIKKDNTIWFKGVVCPIPRTGEPRYEGMDYLIKGPWIYLEELVYQQNWAAYQSGSVGPVQKSRLILGQAYNGTRMTNGAVIQDILQYAIDAGKPIAIGTIDPDFPVPFEEVQDITCAEAIRRMLRWCPDAVTWFDYTQAVPVLHIRRRSNLTPVSINATGGKPVRAVDITARHDLKVNAVVLKYEIQDQQDAATYESLVLDKYPTNATGLEKNALVATLTLSGTKMNHVTQLIRTRDIPNKLADAGNLSWWKQKVPWLSDSKISEINISNVIRSGALPRELIEGSVQDWMERDSEEETIKATVTYTLEKDGSSIDAGADISVRLTSTDCLSKTYSRLTDYEAAEPIPVGLAQKLYSASSVLHYEGRIITAQNEVLGSLRIGMLLNLTNGRTSWSTMNALIQEITEDIDAGTTSCRFGPPMQLGPGDIVELLRANRRRTVSGSVLVRQSGKTTDGGGVHLSGKTPSENTVSQLGIIYKIVLHYGGKFIEIDPSALGSSAPVMKCREIDICVNGTAKKMMILASDPY